MVDVPHRFGSNAVSPMRILVSGATGLVGAALTQRLAADGHEALPLQRGVPGDGRITWDPASGRIDGEKLNGFDAVVHLAGESIAGGRWTEAKRNRIRDSRVEGTRLLASTLATLSAPPKIFVSASAIGYYGNRPGSTLNEDDAGGRGFLADVCCQWEQAVQPAIEASIRTALMRFGVILSRRGGALEKMLPPFRMGLGGVIGSGKQVWSWIDLDDAVGALLHTLSQSSLTGPVNTVAPEPVTNHAFTKALGRVVRRPTLFSMPAFVARVVMGPMVDELLLAHQDVQPSRLLASGYQFQYPDIEASLRHAVGS